MDFRSRLREQIDYLGMMDKEVAALAGISKHTLDSYVGARSSMPSADVAVRLAEVLGVSVEYLVSGKSPVTENEVIKNSLESNSEIYTLMNIYKKLSIRDKKILLTLAKSLSGEV